MWAASSGPGPEGRQRPQCMSLGAAICGVCAQSLVMEAEVGMQYR